MNQQIELTCVGLTPTADPRPSTVRVNPRPNSAPACELMFFSGAPYAHVVQYEDYVRTKRKETESRALLRSQRLRRWRGFEDMMALSSVDAYVRAAPAA